MCRSVCMAVSICLHCMPLCACLCQYICKSACAYISACLHVCPYLCISVSLCACAHTYVCLYVCMGYAHMRHTHASTYRHCSLQHHQHARRHILDVCDSFDRDSNSAVDQDALDGLDIIICHI